MTPIRLIQISKNGFDLILKVLEEQIKIIGGHLITLALVRNQTLNEGAHQISNELSKPSHVYIHAATSDNTRRVYQSDIRHFFCLGWSTPIDGKPNHFILRANISFTKKYEGQINITTLRLTSPDFA